MESLYQFIPLIVLIAVGTIVYKNINKIRKKTDKVDLDFSKSAEQAGKTVKNNKKYIQIAVAIIVGVVIFQYLSPYHSCKRALKADYPTASASWLERQCR
mgnify:CR=1 FL=1